MISDRQHVHASCPAGLSGMSRVLVLGGAVAGMLLLYAVALWWGELNQDEGWYLYAGRLVFEGQVPYRDFASTQGPVMAYGYALAYPLVRAGGILGGRLFTAGLGVLSILLAGCLARRIALRRGIDAFWPVLVVLAFCGLNVYQVYFTTIVKTYALAAVCLLAGLILLERALALVEAKVERVSGMVFGLAAAGGLLLALSAGTRLSAAFVLPACWLPLALRWWRCGRPSLLGHWVAGLLVGGTAGIVLCFVPFLLLASEGLQFGLLTYHAGRAVDGWFPLLFYKAGFVLRLIQSYWPLLAMVMLMGLRTRVGFRRRGAATGAAAPLQLPLWSCFVTVTVVHLLSAFPYDDYQVFIMPLAVVAASLGVGHCLSEWRAEERIQVQWAIGGLMLLLLYSLSGPLLHGWVLAPRDRIWWPLRAESSLGQLRRVGRDLREGSKRADVGGTMITQDTYVAVEAGFRVPAGMEMGPFSNFLDLDDARAQRLRVLNRAGVEEVLSRGDGLWVAYSAYGFSIVAPSIEPLPDVERDRLLAMLAQHFVFFAVEPSFGQAMTDLHIYRRKGK